MAIKKIWFLVTGFLLGAPLNAVTNPAKAKAPPKVEESTPEDDKAAMQQAASEADQWAAKHKSEPKKQDPAPAPDATEPSDSAPANAAALP